MQGISQGFTQFLIVFGFVCAVVGWAFIEFLIWVFSHVSFNF
jgi:hypothetical protein